MVTFLGAVDDAKSDDRYMKFKEGDNKFRILQDGVEGYESWFDKKPIRNQMNTKKPSGSKYFTAWKVWDYSEEKIKVLCITQVGINKALASFQNDAEWGTLTEYDLKVTRKTEGTFVNKDGEEQKSVKYTAQAVPPKPISAKIKEALEATEINLDALFYNGDPWKDFTPMPQVEEVTQFDLLQSKLHKDKIATAPLQSFLMQICESQGKTQENVIESALMDKFYPMFVASYLKYIKAEITA